MAYRRCRPIGVISRILTGGVIGGLVSLGLSAPAYAFAHPPCTGTACTVTGGGGGGGGGGSGSGGGGSYTPIYPPPEPGCIDQGGAPRPVSIQNLVYNGQTYDDEYIGCFPLEVASPVATGSSKPAA